MPSGTIHNLGARVRKLAEQAEKGMARKVQTAAMETARHAILNTPVDRGDARASWQVGIDQRSRGRKQPPYFPHPVLHSAIATYHAGRFHERANASPAIRAVQNEIRRARLDDTIYLTNAVKGEDGDHYLPDLNTGESGTLQVEPFWIQRAEAEGREAARKTEVFD